MAASPRAALAGRWGHRLGGDRAERVGFAIETKTWVYDERQLGRVLEQARWLGRRRRRWWRLWALPVLCVVRAAGVERYERGVLVVSIDRLVPVLWEVANGAERSQPTPLHGLSVL